MKKKIVSIVLVIGIMLSCVTGIMAAIGDVYPEAGLSQASDNGIFKSIKNQITGAGEITQTSDVWRYQYVTRGVTNADAVYYDMSYKNSNGQLLIDANTSYPRFFTSYNCQPGNGHDAVMTFTAPESGIVEVSNANDNKMIKTNSAGANARQDGVYARIVHNKTQIWPDPGTGTDSWAHAHPTVVQDTVYVNVEKGDKIYFRLNSTGYLDNDGTWWNPTVKYVDVLSFEKEAYYGTYTSDNESSDYSDINKIEISANVLDGVSGNLVYESDNTAVAESDGVSGNWIIKGVGTANLTAKIYNGEKVLAEAKTTLTVYPNIVGGPFEYFWNGAPAQGPVWHYMAYTSDGYKDYDKFTKNATYNFFTVTTSGDAGYIRTDNRMHPGVDGAPTLAFCAPKSGLVEVGALSGLYPQVIDTNTTDGIRYRICHNDKTVYPENSEWINVTEVNQQNSYENIYVTVEKGDYIYFTLDKNSNKTGDMSAWSPTVKYLPVSFQPNPYELKDTVSIAPNVPVTDRGFSEYDSLQVMKECGFAEISVTGTENSASSIADAKTAVDTGSELLFSDNGTVDIIFPESYTGDRTLKDMQIMLHSTGGVSTKFSIDLYYSTLDDKENLKELYSAAEIRDRSYSGYPFIRLEEFSGKVNDVYKIHIKINNKFGGKTNISEIDVNMAEESEQVLKKRKELQSPLKMPKMFSDNFVIQRDEPIRLWGYGGTEKVFVELKSGDETVRSAYADVFDGKWNVELESVPGGHTVYTLEVSDVKNDENKIRVNNILAGDIWVASGQSNMDFPMYKTSTYSEDKDLAVYDEVRYFAQRTMGAMSPLEDSYYGVWSEATGDNIYGYSAVAYQFARELYEQNGKEIPIAVVPAKMSGTRIQAWMSEELLNSDADFKAVNNLKSANPFSNASNSAAFEQRAAASYNALLNPFLSMNIKGVIWYQGEENSFQPDFYKKALPALMNTWREKFGNEDMPFYIVQLPSYVPTATNARWPQMRQVQLQIALKDKNSGFIVTTDVGEKNDIHPTDKRPVGKRLAYLAAAKTYGKDIEYSGPLFEKAVPGDNGVTVYFTHNLGLKAQIRNKDGSFTVDESGKINGFELSADGVNFVPAEAVIVGDTVVVSGVENPVALRFGWMNFAEPALNLYNSANLPASPFRIMSFSDKQTKPEVLKEASEATISGELKNDSSLLMSAFVMMVSYDSKGAVFDVKAQPVSAVINDTYNYSYKMTIPENGSVRAYLWKDLETLIPLSDYTEIK